MCHRSSLYITSQTEAGYIGQCESCGHYNFAHKNILLTFSEGELYYFMRMLEEMTDMLCVEPPLPNGKNIIIKTPLPNLFICLSDAEFNDIKAMINETILIAEARKIVSRESV